MDRQANIPLYLLSKYEEILRGDHDSIWGLLFAIMKNKEYFQNKSIKENDSNYMSNEKVIPR